MRSVGRVYAWQSHNFPRTSGSRSRLPTTLLPTQRRHRVGGGSERSRRRVVSARSSQYVRPNPLPEDPASPLSLPHALYFAIRTNISSPAAPRDLGAERLINAWYDERARHHHDSPTATPRHEAGWLAGRDLPFVSFARSFGLARLDFRRFPRHHFDLVPLPPLKYRQVSLLSRVTVITNIMP